MPARPAGPTLPGSLLVAAGGTAGAAAREAVGQALPATRGAFPVATFLVNISGAFVLGLLLDALAHDRSESMAIRLRLLAGTGFLGAFTTYSTFAVEIVQLGRVGHVGVAAGYAAATMAAGLIAGWAGIRLGRPAAAAARRLPLDPDIDGPDINGPEDP